MIIFVDTGNQEERKIERGREMIINHSERFEPSISQMLSVVPQFRTKQAAIEEGKKYGWNTAIKVEKRFESCWVVGKKDFQDSCEGELTFECYRFPLLKWEDINGVKTNPVLTCRKFKEV